MLELCRLVRSGAPELWSTFLRFSSKTSVIDFVRDEDAFAYFDFYGSPRVMHFLTRVGISPRDRNVHYCLDLAGDIEALRNLEEQALAEHLKVEPRPIRRLKVNGSPLLYPLWDIERPLFRDTSEEELMRTASLVRADPDFMERLTNAAAASEVVYPASEHVELQIYGAGFFSDADRELWSRRPRDTARLSLVAHARPARLQDSIPETGSAAERDVKEFLCCRVRPVRS
jgi:exodeoxyribonuclease-1